MAEHIPGRQKLVHIIILACLVFALFGAAAAGQAQSQPGGWSAPVNLSRSGSTSNPQLFADSGGVLHAVWEDRYSGFMHSRYDGTAWTAPEPLPSPWVPVTTQSIAGKFPVDAPVPVLIADRAGFIYAFWIDATNQLFAASTTADTFGSKTLWSKPEKLSDSALSLAVAVDGANQVHLAYINQRQRSDKPAGVYYQNLPQNGSPWSKPVLLAANPYFRGMDKTQASLSIATSDAVNASTILVAWDNRPLKRVYLDRSVDGGQTWEQAREISGPGSDTAGTMPFNIAIGSVGENAVLVWQVGQPGGACRQYFQGSGNSGSSWSPRQLMLATVSGCPQSNQFIAGPNGSILLAANILNQVYLQAWNGSAWSEPQLEGDLFGFIDPETYSTVNLHAQQFIFTAGNRLYVLACDASDQGDTWLTSQTITSTATWFQPGTKWNPLQNISNNTQPTTGIALVAEGDQIIHALWVQRSTLGAQALSIFYARWNGDSWSTPVMVQQQPDGDVSSLSAALDQQGRLLLTWSGGPYGKVYFSWANASRASSSGEWAKVISLPSPQPAGSSPRILVGANDSLYITYAIPWNEDRGIYLVSSQDEGLTWSAPVRVFDAAAAGWSHLDNPGVYQDGSGRIGVTWIQMTLQDSQPQALYQSYSTDQGQTWSAPQKIAQAGVVWSQVIAGSASQVYLAWMEKSSALYSLRFTTSPDGGTTWAPAQVVTNPENTPGAASMLLDPAGRLHILFIAQAKDLSMSLEHWQWDGHTWAPQDSLSLGDGMNRRASRLGAVLNQAGQISVAIASDAPDQGSRLNNSILQSSALALDLPAAALKPTPVPLIVPSPTPTARPTLQPTQTQISTPEVVVSNSGASASGLLTTSWGGLAVGAVFSGLAIVFGLVINRYNRRNR